MTTDEQFTAFWRSYPNRKGKGDAIKAFKAAIKLATLDEIISGITLYVANKPDWQAYKHPGPWLRGMHWLDEWEPQQAKAPSFPSRAQKFQSREDYLRAEIERAERSFSR
jgi:hypothetical protein